MAILIAFTPARERIILAEHTAAFPPATPKRRQECSRNFTGGELYKIEQAQPYSENYRTCVNEARDDLQRKHARRF